MKVGVRDAGVAQKGKVAIVEYRVVDVRGNGVETVFQVPEIGIVVGASVFGEIVNLQKDFPSGHGEVDHFLRERRVFSETVIMNMPEIRFTAERAAGAFHQFRRSGFLIRGISKGWNHPDLFLQRRAAACGLAGKEQALRAIAERFNRPFDHAGNAARTGMIMDNGNFHVSENRPLPGEGQKSGRFKAHEIGGSNIR